MYGFNGQYPGPLIQVDRRATVVVNFENRIDQPSAVHWHGIRLDNRFDGTPHVTQELVPSGGRFRYVVHFPDAGIYWYHPHHREDTQQDLGLYGNLFVRPGETNFFAPHIARNPCSSTTFFLPTPAPPLRRRGGDARAHGTVRKRVLGQRRAAIHRLRVQRGEVVRFYLTNAANSRVFNLLSTSFAQAPVEAGGRRCGTRPRARGDGSERVPLAPAERYIVETRFERRRGHSR